MAEPIAFWGNQFVPLADVKLAINDAGFIFGATATDLCRTFRGKLYRLSEHLTRFQRSCEYARIPCRLEPDSLASTATRLVEHNFQLLSAGQELVLVMFATPGEIGYYRGQPGGAGDNIPTLCMHTFPLPFQRYAQHLRDGARLATVRSDHASLLPNAKHRSRLHWWLAEQTAKQTDPRANALVVERDGSVTETASANFLVVYQGAVHGPRRERILPGISLEAVRSLCLELGIDFQETDLRVTDRAFLDAEEAILTSTPYCLAPVSRIDDRQLPVWGPVAERLLRAWSEQVGVDIRQQIVAGV